MKNEISFNLVTPSYLSQRDIGRIFELEQDMWARKEGLGEYLQCTDCDRIHSKQDVYDKKDKEIYNLTVSEIERKKNKFPRCIECDGEMKHSFNRESYIQDIVERYSGQAHMVMMMGGDNILGFMDGYVSDIDTIYRRELEDHYGNVGVDKIKQMVKKRLNGKLPDKFFSCSSSGTRERYMNMIHIFNLLQKFFEGLPLDMQNITALSELHSGGPYTKIFSRFGASSIGIRNKYKELINTTMTYDSDIYVHENFGKKCKKAFEGVDRGTFFNHRD